MNGGSEWESLDWLESARQLVHWINGRNKTGRLLMVVRHSHREVIEDHSSQFSTGLTELGKRMSYEMGLRLRSDLPVHLFFSFVPRCYQTAEEIARGLNERGAEIDGMDPLAILVMPEYTDETVWANLQPDGHNVHEFVNRWADGEFGDKIQDFAHYTRVLIDETIGRLRRANEPVLHVHVTHDLALMAMKRALLGTPLRRGHREPYLGGLAVSIGEDGKTHRYIAEWE